jgi:phasin
MANEGFALPPEMRAFAEDSMAQAKRAFDGFITATQRAAVAFEGQANTAQAGVRDVTQKAMTYAERNVATSFDFAQKLLRATDADEVIRLHREFIKAQIQAFEDQARDLAQAATPRRG